VVEKAPKAPINPNVPAEYKNPVTGTYLPGHDAKHKSYVAKAILAGGDEQALLAELGSDKLREGAIKQVETAQAKYATTGTAGFVVIKNQEYEARKLRGDGGIRVDGENGWELHPVDSKIGKTFESVADREKNAAEATEAGLAE